MAPQSEREPLAIRLKAVLRSQKSAYRQNPYPAYEQRRDHLQRLERAVLANKDDLARALDADFGGRCYNEVLFSELFASLHAIRHTLKHFKGWMARRPRRVDWPLQPARAWLMPQPLGVIGIISPWNYPILLTVAPLAGALAAGNRVMIKLSEFTPATSERLSNLISDTYSPDHVTVVNGDRDTGRAFASLRFDHLLFTGSAAIGRDVMRAAAENLTPVTLELGGKSPAIIAPDAEIDSAAGDIAYGKFINAGQTCIAPDYVLVFEHSLDAFLTGLQREVERYWPEPALNPDYTCVINESHVSRLHGYVEDARSRGARVITIGPPAGNGSRRFAPTLILNPPDDSLVMREEIFGPVLPVRTYLDMKHAIDYVNDHERPLALYLFTQSNQTCERVLSQTVSGAACVNDTLVYIVAETLPFGGVGSSGFGHYHGEEGFNTFSKVKPVFERRWPGLSRTLRPPYGRMHVVLKRFLIG